MNQLIWSRIIRLLYNSIIFMCIFVAVYMCYMSVFVWMYMHMYVGTYVCTCIWREAKDQHQVSLSIVPHLIFFFETDSPSENGSPLFA